MKSKKLENLKLLYLFIFIVSAVLVVPTHIFSPPSFMAFRFPHYLEMMGPFLGVSWPLSFEIYHYALYTLAIIGSLNALGILFHSKLRSMAIFSSLIGIFLILLMVLFFFFQFIKVNPSTAIILGLYSIALLIVDILTFEALITKTRQKEASRG